MGKKLRKRKKKKRKMVMVKKRKKMVMVEKRKKQIGFHLSLEEWKWELLLRKILSKPCQVVHSHLTKWECQLNLMIASTEITSSEIKLNLTQWLLKLLPKDKI